MSSTPTQTRDELRIDRYVPAADVSIRRTVVVDADPETTLRAAWDVDLLRLGPAATVLGWLRALPAVVEARLAGEDPPEDPDEMTLAGLREESDQPWVILDESPTELVVGGVGKPWNPTIEWADVDPAAFADFDDPGWAKIAFALVARPYGDGRTLLTYDVRTELTDRRSRRRFRRYWTVIRHGVALLMRGLLRQVKAEAEGASGRAGGGRVDVQVESK
jgi:hypothetical protein